VVRDWIGDLRLASRVALAGLVARLLVIALLPTGITDAAFNAALHATQSVFG